MTLRPCVFFDRDGIVNESPGPGRYVTCWDEFHLIPAFVEALRVAHRHGYVGVLATNQRAVARGLMTLATLDAIHRRLADLLTREHGISLLDIACCPHAEGACACRKPQPGLLLSMAAKHRLDLPASWMVGDAETDIEAGRRAGCRTVRIGPLTEPSLADARAAAMEALPALLETVLASPS